MKSMILAALFASFSAHAASPEVTVMLCDQFKNAEGQSLDGISSPTIVNLTNDASKGKDYYVMTKAVVPNAQPRYERLVKVSQQIEGSQYESEHYKVDFIFFRGSRAHIVMKGSNAASNCEMAKAQ